jgi:hypothetical protein
MISTVLILISLFFALVYLKGFVEDANFRKNFMDAVKLFRS